MESNNGNHLNSIQSKTENIKISEELKRFLNSNILYKDSVDEAVNEKDITEIIDIINKKNEVRTNSIRIQSNIVDEFLDIIEKFTPKEFVLGELEVDICNKSFEIEKFVKSHKNILYNLKLKINSIDDIKNDNPEFLNSRYGIVYNYANEDYHYEDLLNIVNKIHELLPENYENTLESAKKILNYIFQQFELFESPEYKIGEEKIHISNLKFVDDNGYYSKLMNIFKERKSNKQGLQRLCREVLKVAGYNIINNIESVSNTIKKHDVIIENRRYQIIIDSNKIRLEE